MSKKVPVLRILFWGLICLSGMFCFLFHSYISGNKIFIFQFPTNIDHLIGYWPYRSYIFSGYDVAFLGNFQFSLGIGDNPFSLKMIYFDIFNFMSLLIKLPIYLVILMYYAKIVMAYFIIVTALKYRNNNILTIQAALFALFFALNGMFVYWSVQDSFLTEFVLLLLIWLSYEIFRQNNKIIFLILTLSLTNIVVSVYLVFIFNALFFAFILCDICFNNTKLEYNLNLL